MKKCLWWTAGVLSIMAVVFALSLFIRWPAQYQALAPDAPAAPGMRIPGVPSMAFSPDGKTLALAGDLKVKLWNVASRRETATLAGHAGKVTCLAYNVAGTLLASGSADRTIKLWEVPSGKEVASLEGHAEGVIQVAFSPDGKTLASGSTGKPKLQLWDVATGKPKMDLPLWIGNDKEKKQLDEIGKGGQVSCLAFSPDGKVFAAAFVSPAIFWDTTTGLATGFTKTPQDVVISLAFSPDSKFLAVGDFHGLVQVSEFATGKELPSCAGSDHIVFSPDGTTLATVDSFGVKFWDVATGNEKAKITHGQRGWWFSYSEMITSLAFSPDRKTLVTAGDGGTIQFWDLANVMRDNK
jgi:WD40 repeat protein